MGASHSGLRNPCVFGSDIYTTKEKHKEEIHNQTHALKAIDVDSPCNTNSIMNNDEEENQSIKKQGRGIFKCKFCDEEFVGKYHLGQAQLPTGISFYWNQIFCLI